MFNCSSSVSPLLSSTSASQSKGASEPVFSFSFELPNASASCTTTTTVAALPSSSVQPEFGSSTTSSTTQAIGSTTTSPTFAFGKTSPPLSPVFGTPFQNTDPSTSPAFSSPFGFTNPSTSPAFSSPFQSTNPSTSPMFGTTPFLKTNPSTTSSTTQAIGSTTTSPTLSFGKTSPPLSPVFGTPFQNTNPSTSPAFGFPFGNTNPSTSPMFGTPFLKTNPSASPVFGSPFGNTNPSTSPAFGSTFGNTSPPTSPLFGSPFRNTNPSPVFSYPFQNTNPPTSPPFGCGFSFAPSANASSIAPPGHPFFNISSTPRSIPASGFDFSSIPLHCFLNFPPTSFSSPGKTPSIFNKLTPSSAAKPLTPTSQVSQHVSLKGQHVASGGFGYYPTPDSEIGPLISMLMSTSAMPIYKDKCHEELRWQDYQSQGKAQGHVAPACKSAASGRQLLAIPVFVLPAIPPFTISGVAATPWTPSLGSTVCSCSSTHSGTAQPAFAASPIIQGLHSLHLQPHQ